MKQNHIELFSASIKLPDVNETLSPGTIDNDIFDSYKSLLSEISDTLYKFAFKHIFKMLRRDSNLAITFNYNGLDKNIISILVTFSPPDRFDENTQDTLNLFSIYLNAAINVLKIEKEYTNTTYEYKKQNNELITQITDNELLKLYYRHEEIIILANNVEKHLHALFTLKSINTINIIVNNQHIILPILKMITPRLTTEGLMGCEKCSLTFISTIDLVDSSAYEVRFPTSPKSYKLLHVDQDSRGILQRAARYNDTLVIEVHRVTEIKRSIHTKKHEFEFIRISDNQVVEEQFSLFKSKK